MVRGRLVAPRFFLFMLALAGSLAGCTVIVSDSDGHDSRPEDAWDDCYAAYDDCLDEADGAKDAVLACGDRLVDCTEPDGAETAGGGVDAGDSAGQDEPAAEVCVALHQTCVAGADTAQATLACEALFEHCAHPGVCATDPCPKACAGLDACLADHGECVAAASKTYEVEACGVVFAGCVGDAGGDACLPADDARVDECLAEHALCTACADGDTELAACNDVFDVCAHAPM